MADISKIKVDDIEYDVKDATARTTVSSILNNTRDTLGVPGVYNYLLTGNKNINIKFTSVVNAILSCRGNIGTSFATIVYNAYPPGGTARASATDIHKGSAISYSIMDEGAGYNGITISNTSNADLYLSVLVMYGSAPTFETT